MREIGGRGIREGSARWPWRYRLNLDPVAGTVCGELAVEGWEESRAMADWAEARSCQAVKLALGEGKYEIELRILGVRIHESGHYSETDVQVEGRLVKCP
ncbi:MAG: hypothetical protein ACC613_07570 [Synergistales bacterium]